MCRQPQTILADSFNKARYTWLHAPNPLILPLCRSPKYKTIYTFYRVGFAMLGREEEHSGPLAGKQIKLLCI